jgi:hypothetical protein
MAKAIANLVMVCTVSRPKQCKLFARAALGRNAIFTNGPNAKHGLARAIFDLPHDDLIGSPQKNGFFFQTELKLWQYGVNAFRERRLRRVCRNQDWRECKE